MNEITHPSKPNIAKCPHCGRPTDREFILDSGQKSIGEYDFCPETGCSWEGGNELYADDPLEDLI